MTGVIVVTADDMCADELAYMLTVRKMAARGAKFTEAFVSTPVCSPFRASFLTGQRPSGPNGHGIVDQSTWLSTEQREASMPAALEDASVPNIAHTGKWGPGLIASTQPGFTFHRSSTSTGGVDHASQTNYKIWDGSSVITPTPRQSDYLARENADFLAGVLSSGADFFWWYCAHECHTPLEPSTDADARWPGVHWPYSAEDVSDKPAWVQGLTAPSDATVASMRSQQRDRLRELYDLDRQVAAIWLHVLASGRADEVDIIFVSDNGNSRLEHRVPALGKGVPYDVCLRVPLVAVGPSFDGVGTVTAPVAADVDLTAFVVDTFDATALVTQDGTSLNDIVATPGDYTGRAILHHCEAATIGGQSMPSSDSLTQTVSGTRYRYTLYSDDAEELYDLDADPLELVNVEADGAHAAAKATLSANLATELGE